MKKILVFFLFCISAIAYAGFGGMGDVGSDGGGSLNAMTILGGLLFFGGIFWFMTRFKNEQNGFFYLMGGVFLFLVIAGISKCGA